MRWQLPWRKSLPLLYSNIHIFTITHTGKGPIIGLNRACDPSDEWPNRRAGELAQGVFFIDSFTKQGILMVKPSVGGVGSNFGLRKLGCGSFLTYQMIIETWHCSVVHDGEGLHRLSCSWLALIKLHSWYDARLTKRPSALSFDSQVWRHLFKKVRIYYSSWYS